MGDSVGAKAVLAGRQFLGVPYKWGGSSPQSGLDCSGFVQQTYKQLGINLPRTSQEQSHVGQPVPLNALKPGDLVFTEPGRAGPNHVGMYVGHGMIQQSPHTGEVNNYISLKNYLGGGFVVARRILSLPHR
jgi:cell wall-associated NlpC family hydrolase